MRSLSQTRPGGKNFFCLRKKFICIQNLNLNNKRKQTKKKLNKKYKNNKKCNDVDKKIKLNKILKKKSVLSVFVVGLVLNKEIKEEIK